MTIINIFLALEVLLLSWFLVSLPRFCIGNAVGIFITGLLFALTGYSHKLWNLIQISFQSITGRVFTVSVLLIILCFIIYLSILTVLMIKAQRNYPQRSCTVIVLGCRVKNGRPTRMLRRRLDAAYDYLQRFPDAYCILSGGQGSDETISEAEAMYRYLLNKGVNSDRLIKETRSTSTKENLTCSMDIIKNTGINTVTAIATDGFHQYRASLIARTLNIEAYAIPAHTEPRYIFIYWVREWIALTVIFIRKKLFHSFS